MGIPANARGQFGQRRNLAEGREPRAKRTAKAIAVPVRVTLVEWLRASGYDNETQQRDAEAMGGILHECGVVKCSESTVNPEDVTMLVEE